MSSAISSLKKIKKNPLSSAIPFRHILPPNINNADDDVLLEEVTSYMAEAQLRDQYFQSAVIQKAANQKTADLKNAPSDHELMVLMTNRITNLEAQLQLNRQGSADKDKKIQILEEKLKLLQKSRAQGNAEDFIQLEKKCLLLQQQIYEMETFLADYGMLWVGERSNPESSLYPEDDRVSEAEDSRPAESHHCQKSRKVWKPEKSLPSHVFSINCDEFVRNVNELNILAGDGVAKIQHTPDGARLKMPDPVQLILYSNGLLLFDGPFRPFANVKTQELVKDIMDGYFPSELQARYPDGVPLKFTDKRNTIFKDKRSELFQGEGQVLGGDNNRSRLIPSSASKESRSLYNNPSSSVETEIPGQKLTMEQFLNKIPKSVVKNGKIIDIRNSVEEALTGNNTKPVDVTVVDTPQLREIKSRLELSETERPPSSRQITTLRIKSELGDHTYIIKMHFNDTIGNLRKYLNKERSGSSTTNYKIMSAFPKRVFDNDNTTLYECGLTPNAALHLTRN